ncbi:unnamed protein product [Sphagnum troendelagicum]|uniref:Uncharacterized protein n=1 Tax=Sphagnum troendelagicum TaxID=128251 RepID=A0ABP0UPP3_9BRYO
MEMEIMDIILLLRIPLPPASTGLRAASAGVDHASRILQTMNIRWRTRSTHQPITTCQLSFYSTTLPPGGKSLQA